MECEARLDVVRRTFTVIYILRHLYTALVQIKGRLVFAYERDYLKSLT